MRFALLCVLLTGSTGALAAPWSDIAHQLPVQPCQDGWASCYVEDGEVTADLQVGPSGMPMPPTLRVDWFTLEAMPSFSPFAELADYTALQETSSLSQVAEADPPSRVEDPAPRTHEPDPPSRVAAADPMPRSEVAGQQVTRMGSRVNDPVEKETVSDSRQQTRTGRRDVDTVSDLRQATRAGSRGQDAVADAAGDQAAAGSATETESSGGLRPGFSRYGVPPGADSKIDASATSGGGVSAAATADAAPKVEPPKVEPPKVEPPKVEPPKVEPPKVEPPKVEPPKVEPPKDEPATCDDLVALEPAALMGQLSGGQRQCLETRMSAAARQTERDKVSRVLIMDAEARGDKRGWASLMQRHLEDIDRSDPDLCFKYAIYLSRLGVGRSHGVVRWADYALENKSQWQGATYVSRSFALLKLKAEAANRLWQAAETAYVEDRSEENEAKATRYRNLTKEYSREWLGYARASSQDTKNALALCVSAAGNKQYCEGG